MSRANRRFSRDNPPLPPAPANIFEVLVSGACEGSNFVNTFYYWDGGVALASTSEANLGNAWLVSVMPFYKACLSADATIKLVKVQCLTSPTRIPALAFMTVAGTGPAGHEPMSVAVTIVRYSLVKGQSGRGRLSIPAVPTAWVTQSKLTNTVAHNNLAANVDVAFVSGAVTYTPFLISRHNLKHPGLGASQLSSGLLNAILGSSRKRKIPA